MDKNPEEIQAALLAKKIRGLAYRPMDCRLPNGQNVRGLYVLVTDWQIARPTEISFYMMQMACAWEPNNPFAGADAREVKLFNKHVGSTSWWKAICAQEDRVDVDAFVASYLIGFERGFFGFILDFFELLSVGRRVLSVDSLPRRRLGAECDTRCYRQQKNKTQNACVFQYSSSHASCHWPLTIHFLFLFL